MMTNAEFAERDGANAEYGTGIGITLGLLGGGLRTGISRWFNREPNVVNGRWLCPKDDCGGKMVYTGWALDNDGVICGIRLSTPSS